MIARIDLPGIPKSLNAVGSRGSHHAWNREKKKWEGMIFIGLRQAKVPEGLVYVEATAVLHPPTKHKRDEGNFRAILEKALGDILQVGGWLVDDSDAEFRFGRLEFAGPEKPPRTILVLECHTSTDTIPKGEPEVEVEPVTLTAFVCPKCDVEVDVPEGTQPYCRNGHQAFAMRPA